MSIALAPGFPSVEFDTQCLVDGALSDPLPLGAARDADVVITLSCHSSGVSGKNQSFLDRTPNVGSQTLVTVEAQTDPR